MAVKKVNLALLAFAGIAAVLLLLFQATLDASAYPSSNNLPIGTPTPWPTPTADARLTPAAAPRKGIAPALVNAPYAVADRHNFAEWSYFWGPFAPLTTPGAADYVEYVPMAAGNLRETPSAALIARAATRTPTHPYWLVFNECENNSPRQCNARPEDAAVFYHDQVLPAVLAHEPDARFIVGGVIAHPCGIRWLGEFVESYRQLYGVEPPRAGWHFHLYPEIYPLGWDPADEDCAQGGRVFPAPTGGNYNGWQWTNRGPAEGHHAWRLPHWKEDMVNMLGFVWEYGRPEDEIWITEMGCLTPDSWLPPPPAAPVGCNEPGFMAQYVRDITGWLNTDGRWVTRYAWWTDWHRSNGPHTSLYDFTPPDGPGPLPTPGPFETPARSALGNYYAQVTPAAAVPLPWPRPRLPDGPGCRCSIQ